MFFCHRFCSFHVKLLFFFYFLFILSVCFVFFSVVFIECNPLDAQHTLSLNASTFWCTVHRIQLIESTVQFLQNIVCLSIKKGSKMVIYYHFSMSIDKFIVAKRVGLFYVCWFLRFNLTLDLVHLFSAIISFSKSINNISSWCRAQTPLNGKQIEQNVYEN